MLVEGIRAISHQMNCKVIAEGVETQEQRSKLKQMRIDYAQGYYFSRPGHITDLLSALSAQLTDSASLAG
jgi:EAL domain-containing protein (putative c-di-GMP-specific phosphodiesterase class I)